LGSEFLLGSPPIPPLTFLICALESVDKENKSINSKNLIAF
jgi:hypothetical protein